MSDDELLARVDALSRKCEYLTERVDDLEHRNDELHDKIAELQQIVEPDPGQTEYAALTTSQKVHRVRRKLVEIAANTDGKSAMYYDDVMTMFDGRPSPGHCYDLMERAGELDGFGYDKAAGDGGQYRVRCKLAAVNDDALVHAANKAIKNEAP